MTETEFHQLADTELTIISDALEAADDEGLLELEIEGGVMHIALDNGQQFVVSKHGPSKQIWLSSPMSGGLHFSYNGNWQLADGRTLRGLLTQELKVQI